jgi:AcrR family transcriptional regulator
VHQKTDLRVIKTRKNIRESFIALLQHKHFNDITVQNILDTALINRSTFYKYYKDKYDLAEQLAAEYMDLSKSYLDERFHEITDDNLTYTVKKIYTHLLEQKSFILALWKIETDTVNVRYDFEMLLKERCKNHLLSAKSEESMADYYSSLYASIILTTIQWLFKHEEVPVDGIIHNLRGIFMHFLP